MSARRHTIAARAIGLAALATTLALTAARADLGPPQGGGGGGGVSLPVSVSNGGTGATSASAARTALGLAIGSDVQAFDSDLTTLGALGAGARTALGLAIGTNVQAWDGDLDTIAALALTANKAMVVNSAGTAWIASGVSVGQLGACSGGYVAVTNSVTLDSSYAGKIIVFTGTVASTITLPTASTGGGPYTIVYEPASGTPKLKVQTSASGQFASQGLLRCASGGYWQTATVDSTYTLVGVSSTLWVAQGWDGQWGKDN